MIDRGALILAREQGRAYRGVHRRPLDAMDFTGRKGKALARRYADAVVAGEGVLEDLDEALEMLAAAEKMGLRGLDLIVFEVPQEPPPPPRSLPVAPNAPADGLTLLGHDVIEPIEPYWSALAGAPDVARNEHGLIASRAEAESLAARAADSPDADEPPVAVRVWLARAVD